MGIALDEQRIKERTRIWHDVDARQCLRCGRQWRFEDIGNENWYVDSVMENEDEGRAVILCPACW